MDKKKSPVELSSLTTTELVINLANNAYSEAEKREIIGIIFKRENSQTSQEISKVDIPSGVTGTTKKIKKYKKGSKAEKIAALKAKGMNASEIYKELHDKKKMNIYHAEIYRVLKNDY